MNRRKDRHEGWNSDLDLHEDCSIRNGTGSEILLLKWVSLTVAQAINHIPKI